MKPNEPTPKEAIALAMRRAGKKWAEIGSVIGSNPGSAKQFADKALLKEMRAQRQKASEG